MLEIHIGWPQSYYKLLEVWKSFQNLFLNNSVDDGLYDSLHLFGC